MFHKRLQRLKQLAKAIEKQRGGNPSENTHDEKPRRVSNDAFFARMAAMRAKGGACEITVAPRTPLA